MITKRADEMIAKVIPLSGETFAEPRAECQEAVLMLALMCTQLPTSAMPTAEAMIRLGTEFLSWSYGLSSAPGETL